MMTLADLVNDPDGTIRRARELGAAVAMDAGVLVVGHEAVRRMLSDRRVKSSVTDVLHLFGVTSGPFHDWMSLSPLNMDGEEHRRWRQLMSRAFTPQSVQKLRPFMRQASDRLVQGFADAGKCDFVEAFARKYPSLGLCELIGVPAEDRDAFSAWADTIGLGLNLTLCASRIDEIDAALTSLLEYAGQLVEARQKEPRDDLVTRIAQAAEAEAEGGLTKEQFRGSLAGLVFAGHETTKNQLSWMIAVLAEVPHEWDRIREDPDRAREVVEEVLRLRSAVTSVGRTATEDLELAGCPIPKDGRVLASLWGANRCPIAFPNPDVFDAEGHGAHPQLAFGHGPHHCVGAALARAELQEALIALSSAITCPTVEDGVTWLPPLGITGPTRLPISFKRRTPPAR